MAAMHPIPLTGWCPALSSTSFQKGRIDIHYIPCDTKIMIELMMEDDTPGRQKLLDQESRKKPPKLYEMEEKGLGAQAQVKFFTPDNNWTWHAT
jgi:hypothetical protein